MREPIPFVVVVSPAKIDLPRLTFAANGLQEPVGQQCTRGQVCKSITSFTLDENSLKREAPREAYASLRQELSGLAALDERASCMTAWKALTSINKCARNLESALQGETLPAR